MNHDIEDAVERVEAAIQDAAQSFEKAIKQNSSSSVLSPVWIGFCVYIFCAYVPGKVWHSKWRYELQYDVLSTQIHYEKEPRDCDFLAAPLGEKNCSYDRRISTIRWATSTAGHPIASVDDGKTWNTFTPSAGATVPSSPTVEEVYIPWEKKEE